MGTDIAPASLLVLLALASALVVAAVTDLRRREIDNWLTGGLVLAAPLGWWLAGLNAATLELRAIVAAVAFCLLAMLFALRALGGGDVKLLAALALWFAPADYLWLLALTALLGGPLTLACMARHAWAGAGGGRDATARTAAIEVPYGVAIAGAGLCVLAGQVTPAITAALGW